MLRQRLTTTSKHQHNDAETAGGEDSNNHVETNRGDHGVHDPLATVKATAVLTSRSSKSKYSKPTLFGVGVAGLLVLTLCGFALNCQSVVSQKKTLSLPYGEQEDCVYQSNWWHLIGFLIHTVAGFLADYLGTPRTTPLALGGNPWICQECFSSGTCQPLQRRGRCAPFLRTEIDARPRVSPKYNPYSHTNPLTYQYTHYKHQNSHDIPACRLALPCFDLTRCTSRKDGPLKVFPHGPAAEARLDYAVQKFPQDVQKVVNPDDACLFVMVFGSYDTPEELTSNSTIWNHGQNHFIFESARFFDSNVDYPFNMIPDANFEMAAVSQSCQDNSYFRVGYDMHIWLFAKWHRPFRYNQLKLHRPRRLLLSFKGNIYPWRELNWQHRWIAAEYWHNEPDVVTDTKCEKDHHYELTNPQDYEELLLNSTFVFCPGGGVNSFRFAEALAADAIPVVTSDFPAPFEPEIDWSGCLVRVSEARVVNVPQIVRDIPPEEVRERQKKCAILLRKIIGKDANNDQGVWSDSTNQHFAISMKVWSIRISTALLQKEHLAAITLDPPQDADSV